MADIYNLFPIPGAFPKTTPGLYDHQPWVRSKLGCLEKKRECWIAITELLEQELNQLRDQSDPDTELIDSLRNKVQSMLATVENYNTEIKLEKQPEKKLRKKAKVSKQQEKKLRQIAKSGKQIAKSRKQTTKVPKQQNKVLET